MNNQSAETKTPVIEPSEKPLMNGVVLMSSAEHFTNDNAINTLMHNPDGSPLEPVDTLKAVNEHETIARALESAGVEIHRTWATPESQDAVYTANWALIHNGKALMSRLPNKRRPEERPAENALRDEGITTKILPEIVEYFSGQGDALPCGDFVFTQSGYRTSPEAHAFLKSDLGFKKVISLHTFPEYDTSGKPVINEVTGLPDSPTYDIDLALAVLKPPMDGKKGLIAYCPDVFTPESRGYLEGFDAVDKITVSKEEALGAFALNLLSTGHTVIMNAGAPEFQTAIEAHGLKTIPLELPELAKGGGSIRCTTLTLDN